MSNPSDPTQPGWPPPGPPPGSPQGPQPGPQPGPAQVPPQGAPQGPPPSGYAYAPPAPPGPAYQSAALALPPGVELATVGRRIGAYFLAIPLFIVTLGIGYIIWGIVLWNRGTTPALKVLGMKVWRVDTNQVPTFGRMVLREVVGRIVDAILSFITQLISFIMFLTTDQRQSLHDKVATTTVVYDPQKVLG